MDSGRRPYLAYDAPNVCRRSLWKRSKHAFQSSALHANTLSTTGSVAGEKSSKSKDAWAGVVELFCRRQIGKSLIISPGVEFVTGSNAGALVIAGVRVGMSF